MHCNCVNNSFMSLVKNKIQIILLNKTGNSVQINNEELLQNYGFDSFDVVNLIVFLDRNLGGILIDAEYKMDDFSTLNKIDTLIGKLLENYE